MERTRTERALDERPPAAGVERAYEARDLRSVAWEYLWLVRSSPDPERLASAAASMMRVIFGLGEAPGDRAEAAAEAVVIGGVLHGIAPRDEAQWAVAERFFDETTLEDLRHWRPLMGWLGQPAEDVGRCSCGCRWRDRGDTSA